MSARHTVSNAMPHHHITMAITTTITITITITTTRHPALHSKLWARTEVVGAAEVSLGADFAIVPADRFRQLDAEPDAL